MSSYNTAVNMYSRGCRLWGQRWVIGVSPLAGYPATKCWIRPWTRMPASAKKNLLQLDFLVLDDRRYSRVHLLVQPLLLSSQVLRNTGVLRQPRLPLRNDHIGCGRQVEGRGVCQTPSMVGKFNAGCSTLLATSTIRAGILHIPNTA